MLANQLVYFAADISFHVRHDLLHLDAFPSVSDFLYFTLYPLLVAAVFLFVRLRTSGRDHLTTGCSAADCDGHTGADPGGQPADVGVRDPDTAMR